MSHIQNSIGLRWENILQEKYPSLISTSGNRNVPDFYHPSGFWIEAKAGNIGWGARIKEYQLEQIEDFKEPVVYSFGMHDLENATRNINQKTEKGRQNYLERNMNVLETYFISSDIVKQISEKEKRVSQKGLVYCMVKPSILRNIILDREFKRNGIKIASSAEYYGFDREKYFIETNSGVSFVLNLETEKNIIDFLS